LAIVGRWLIAAPRLSTATKDFSDKSDSVDKKNESVKGVSGGGIAL
jgi:hypothetical protein